MAENSQSGSDDISADFYDEEDEKSFSEHDSGSDVEKPLSDEEIEELIEELLHVESKAAEAQEMLEEESLARVERNVRSELSLTLSSNELEDAIKSEINSLKQKWQTVLDDLQDEISILQEQLDDAGVDLPALYKWIEKQNPEGCSTEAWRRHTHWIGCQTTEEISEYVKEAESDLHDSRPVRRHHGKCLEQGASGYLQKKLCIMAKDKTHDTSNNGEWTLVDCLLQNDKGIAKDNVFGTDQWAAVYFASTPQQAANLGLNLPGVNEVEEIDDIENYPKNPTYTVAIANENECDLTEEQKCKIRKVREEDDVRRTRRMHNRLKERRERKKRNKLKPERHNIQNVKPDENFNVSPVNPKKRYREVEDIKNDGKVTVIIDSDDENATTESRTEASECSKEYHCTACDEVLETFEICIHPLLGVIVCESCKYAYEDCSFEKDVDGSESFCSWCSKGGNLICCDKCEKVFCEECITRNLGATKLMEIRNFDWNCFCCMPQTLSFLIDAYTKPLNSRKFPNDSDTDQFSFSPGLSNFRRTKRLRTIIDDADLTEETKEKIAIEKDRQNHIKMLQGMHMLDQWTKSPIKNSSNQMWPDESTLYGNAAEGFIVNIARGTNEGIVRVPPSISVCLKSHQVSGIQFMWENCIQSINRIKSGDKGLGCILAHSMGLGKTLQVITFLYIILRSIDIGLKTALIVTPVNVLHNWKREFDKWRPLDKKCLPTFMLDDASREYTKRVKFLKKWAKKGGVLLMSYATFRNLSLGKHMKDKTVANDIPEILQSGPDILICDEAHIIKNTKADITQALKQVKTQRRIALTGSPLQNNLMEYYCMVDFVREGFLGKQHEFRNRFQNPIENGQHANSTAEDVKLMKQRSHVLYEQLKGFVQRMSMNVMKNDLPPKSVYVISVKLSTLQRQLYMKFLKGFGFMKTDENEHLNGKRKCFFTAYHSLAKIWNHPGLLLMSREDRDAQAGDELNENFIEDSVFSDDDIEQEDGEKMKAKVGETSKNKDTDKNHQTYDKWWDGAFPSNYNTNSEDSGKMMILLDLLKMSSEYGDKVLVFSQSLNTLDLIESFMLNLAHPVKKHKHWRRGKEWYRLDGSTSGAQRQKLVEEFNEPSNTKVQCVLISTRAGSLGINLTAANRVIVVDGSWNPTHDLQALFRAWRIGQTKHVYAYRLVAHGTMEEKIYKRQVAKEGLAARVLDKQQVYRTVNKEEILNLFRLEDSFEDTRMTGSDTSSVITSTNHLDSSQTDASFMKHLLSSHYPSWLVSYHEHEALLQENEDERLSKEEQQIAWDNYKKYIEAECVKQTIEKCNNSERIVTSASGPESVVTTDLTQKKANTCNQPVEETAKDGDLKKCPIGTHATLLHESDVKLGCTICCPKCLNEISWETLRSRR